MEYTVNIFVSSTFRDMHSIRNQLIYQVRPLISNMLNQKNVEVKLNFIDLRWGVDERKFKDTKGNFAQVLEACFRSLDDADILIGLYTEYRGIVIPDDEIDLINAQNQWELPYNYSLTELEYWYCQNIKKKHTKYCLVQFQKNTQQNTEISVKRGIITVNGNPGEELNEILAQDIVSLIDSIVNERNLMKQFQTDSFMIRRTKQINQIVEAVLLGISDFFDNNDDTSVKLIVLTGESGIGKSVLLSQLSETLNIQDFIMASYLPDARDIGSLDELLMIALRENDIEIPEEKKTLAEMVRYLRQNLNGSRIPCFIIDSLDEISPEYFNHFLVELSHNFQICYVITSTTKSIGMEYKRFLHKSFELKEFTKEELEDAIRLHEKALSKQFPHAIKQKLLTFNNTQFAKPIVFQLILNDLSWLSTDDYISILDSNEYSAQIENIMMNKLSNYSTNINEMISAICTRITGNAGVEEENVLINKYLSLIILSYMGINESYMSDVMGVEWKPLLFYQLRYNFRTIFTNRDGLISISHRIFTEIFERIISQEVFVEMAHMVINTDMVLSNGLEFEKHRMCFFIEDFEKWFEFVHKENEWGYLTACLNEYSQPVPVFYKEYLSIPCDWIQYTIKQSDENHLSKNDYNSILRSMHDFLYELINSTSTSLFDNVVEFCKQLINALIIFKKNSGDVEVEQSCNEIIEYYYQNVINCAERFSVHEMVKGFIEEYESIVDSINAVHDHSNMSKADYIDYINERMVQLFNIAKFKEDTDRDRSEVTSAYKQVLQLSIDSNIIFPNFSNIIEYLHLYSDNMLAIKYVDFVVSLIDNKLKNNGRLTGDEIHYYVNANHFKVMYELQKETFEDNKDELIELASKGYRFSRTVYEMKPNDLQALYDYSMACSDMALTFTLLKDFKKVKALNETIMQLKGYLYHHYPDTFIFAESYSAFIHNCSNNKEIYSEEQCIDFEDESFSVLMPYLELKNVRASWIYLNHWEMVINNIKNHDELSEYDKKLLIQLQKYLSGLPNALNCIFESNEDNIIFRKEAIQKIAEIYNTYRSIADRPILRIIGKSLYDVAVQICEIEDSDSSYLFLASTIETLCADQSVMPQETLMDDSELLKLYKAYIENKLIQQPKRIVLHYAMIIVPETEMITMLGMLAGVENMPSEANLMFQMLLDRLNLDPISIILEKANKMIDRMRIIQSLGGDIPQNNKEILKMTLLFLLQRKTSRFNEITSIIDTLKSFDDPA